jgi:succinyl-CoA synthetase beta subunit
MARKKLSEFKAKSLLCSQMGRPYQGIEVKPGENNAAALPLDPSQTYVVKVDQGIKKRLHQGLVKLDLEPDHVPDEIANLRNKGFARFLVEPFLAHAPSEEKYLSFEREREGLVALYSEEGGVDVEKKSGEVKKLILNTPARRKLAAALDLPAADLQAIVKTFENHYFSFLEINPLLVRKGRARFLDLAVEVDDAAEFFVNGAWSKADFVAPTGKSAEEEQVERLNRRSQASLKLDLLNPDGSIFMLLSGGGASLVLADEVCDQNFGRDLANYGEYSGNPTAEETYLYTKSLLSLLLKSKAKKKILVIAGGVANFTDVRTTFRGVTQALEEEKQALAKEKVKVFVRRGGPGGKEALAAMTAFLKSACLFGRVAGPELPLTDIVRQALACLEEK